MNNLDLGNKKSWETLSKELHYKNERFEISKERFVTPRKTEGVYYVLEGNPGVKIVALDGDDIILVEEFRYPIGKRILEVPGGGTDGQDLEIAARRELSEETGVQAGSMKYCGCVYTLPGLIRGECHVFLAKDLTFHKRNSLDDTEADSSVVRLNKWEVYRLLDSGEILNSLSSSVLLLVRKYMDL